MSQQTLERPDRVVIDPKTVSTPNLKAIREAAKDFAKVQAERVPRSELLRRLANK